MFKNIDWANLQNPHLFINGDCMEYMKTMPDKYVDLCICDPPYGININHNIGRRKGDKSSNYKLDTHVGSASSLIACHKLGFEYWGFEIDPDYYALATARLEAVKAQISIFDEPEPTEKLEQAKFI